MGRIWRVGAIILSLMLIWPMDAALAQNTLVDGAAQNCPNTQEFRDEIIATTKDFHGKYFEPLPQNAARFITMLGYVRNKACVDQMIDNSIIFLSQDSVPESQIWTALRIMFALDRDHTLKYLTKLITSGAYRKLDDLDFSSAVTSSEGKDYDMRSDFDDRQVHAFLLALMNNDDIKARHFRLFDHLFTGYSWIENWRSRHISNAEYDEAFNFGIPLKSGAQPMLAYSSIEFPFFTRLFRNAEIVSSDHAANWVAQILSEQKSLFFANMTAILAEEHKALLKSPDPSAQLKKIVTMEANSVKGDPYQRLAGYFDSGLSSPADSEDWLRLWRIWSPDFSPPQGMDMKAFVTLVRDELKKQ